MKKIVIILSIIVTVLVINKNENQNIIIPKKSIRFRVIANSNSESDQKTKNYIVNSLKKEINLIMKSSNSYEDSKKNIKNNIGFIEKNINISLNKLNKNESIDVKYGKNYFPEKIYKGIKYEAGDYESLVITLGKGKGKNFWCVLFPPLCMIDSKTTNKSEVEYKSYVKEILDKYLKL